MMSIAHLYMTEVLEHLILAGSAKVKNADS